MASPFRVPRGYQGAFKDAILPLLERANSLAAQIDGLDQAARNRNAQNPQSAYSVNMQTRFPSVAPRA